MKKNPIDQLLTEHVKIMEEFQLLRGAIDTLNRLQEEGLAEALPVFKRIGQIMSTMLDLHRRKEDDVLFPALERKIGSESATGVMRQEHKDIHSQGVLLRETLRELNEEEHPEIEARAEKLRDLVLSGGEAEALRKTGEEILYLLDIHFRKEEEILFPMGLDLLDRETLDWVSEQFEAMERVSRAEWDSGAAIS